MTQVSSNGHKRAVLYARVSTDDQADKGYSLPSQFDAMRKYAERQGFEIVAELSEDYTGFKPIAERPEGKKLAAMLKARDANTVIAYQVDRLSREIVNLLATVQMWLRAGIEIHTCDIGKIESEIDIVLVIKGWQGSDERKKIMERTARGRNGKANAGKVVGSNRAPFGYRFVRDQNNKVIGLEIYETQAGIVRLIFKWYVDERLPMFAIAKRLEEMKIPTPGGENYKSRGARGIWSHTIIATILDNETYAGDWHFGYRKGASKTRTPKSEHIIVSVPSIVDRATWKRAQELRASNKATARRNAKRDYLLRGLITCGCGIKMTGRSSQTRHSWNYTCNARHYLNTDCHEPNVSGEYIEAQVWQGLKDLVSDTDKMKSELIAAQQRELTEREPKRDELQAIEATIANTEKQAADLARSIHLIDPNEDDDNIVAKKLRQDVKRTNELYKAQIKRRDEIITELGAQTLTDEEIGDLMQYAEDVRAVVRGADPSKRRYFLERLKVSVKITNGHFVASSILGGWEGDVMRRSEIIANRNRGLSIESGIFRYASPRRCRTSIVRD
jgi:site-specific DNA recombinase